MPLKISKKLVMLVCFWGEKVTAGTGGIASLRLGTRPRGSGPAGSPHPVLSGAEVPIGDSALVKLSPHQRREM